MAKQTKWALLAVSAVILCWLAAFAIWQGAARTIGTGELVLFGLVVPFAAGLVVWLIGKKLNAVDTPAASPSEPPAPAPVIRQPAQPTSARTHILDGALLCRGGQHVDELRAYLAEHLMPELDPELINDEGFPIRSYRIAELSVDAPDEAVSSQQQRMQALLNTVLASLQDSMAELFTQGANTPAHSQANAHNAAQMHPGWHGGQTTSEPSVTPSADTSPVHIAFRLYLDHANYFLADELTASLRKWLRQWPQGDSYPVECIECGHAGSLPSDLNHITQRLHASPATQAVIALACHSDIDQQIISQWQQKGWLATTPNGKVPGEVAAGLILSNQSPLPDKGTLDTILTVPRTKPANAGGRIQSKELTQLLQQTAPEAANAFQAAQHLLVDAETISPAAAELGQWWLESFPDCDDAQLLRLGSCWGQCGPAGQLALLVAAMELATSDNASQLVVMAADPIYRSMCQIRPANA
ncbi:hypothetical protein HNQ59_000993 [Chitinivorax tropicus]|uniref:Transmembrane protein n=1 Tax=Chitinivorax tropicus TaxID=714531 RepID=A0A840MEN5_9PROT|nr:hypothetical protein [Chitinivorax tropicus]MBB5017724.1 hypothetical protein [Chitinivorax tropicus]